MSDDFVGAIVAALVALVGIIFGVYQYRKGQIIQRQQVLFGLIRELNKPGELDHAKKLLGYGYVEILKKTKNPNGSAYSYSIQTLPFLKDYNKESNKQSRRIEDPYQLEIKSSLDSFIVFLGKVGYSLSIGAIAPNEIIYFQYWIRQTSKDPTIIDYITNNEFPLYRLLLKELVKNPHILVKILAKFRILDKWSKSYQYPEELRTAAADALKQWDEKEKKEEEEKMRKKQQEQQK